MIRVDKLVGEMYAKGISGKEMAKRIGIVPKTFYEKMKKGVFSTDEVEIMIEVLQLSDPMSIFFGTFSKLQKLEKHRAHKGVNGVNNEAELQKEADEVRKNIAAYINRITQNTAADETAAIAVVAVLPQAVNAYIELLKITRVTS